VEVDVTEAALEWAVRGAETVEGWAAADIAETNTLLDRCDFHYATVGAIEFQIF